MKAKYPSPFYWAVFIMHGEGKEDLRVEYTYKDGDLVAITYEFFDKKGNRIGFASYDAKTGTVEAKRSK